MAPAPHLTLCRAPTQRRHDGRPDRRGPALGEVDGVVREGRGGGMDRLRRLVPGSAPQSTTSHPWKRAGDPAPVLPQEGARRMCSVAVVIVVVGLVVWQGL
jgi:hypothetical protein